MDRFCPKTVCQQLQAIEGTIATVNKSISQVSNNVFEKHDHQLQCYLKSLKFHGLKKREKFDLYDDIEAKRTRVVHRKLNTLRVNVINRLSYVEEITKLVLSSSSVTKSKELQSDIKLVSLKAKEEYELLLQSVNNLVDCIKLCRHRLGFFKKVVLNQKIIPSSTFL